MTARAAHAPGIMLHQEPERGPGHGAQDIALIMLCKSAIKGMWVSVIGDPPVRGQSSQLHPTSSMATPVTPQARQKF